MIGFGCLVLLGLGGALIFGKRDEKIYALVVLAIIGLAVAFLPGGRDRRTDAALQNLLKDLSEHEAALKRETDTLPVISDKPSRAELNEKLNLVIEQLHQQAKSSRDLSHRVKELLPRVSGDGQARLHQGLERFAAQAWSSSEQRDAWIEHVREKVKGMAKGKPNDLDG
ncbi:MAG: hypothetical protein L0Y71_08595 [Gemmataceae bacterium]|nr:hypothetical protein [Gemmataceae bacterium]